MLRKKRKGPASLFGREAEVSVGALKTKSCLSKASSFCLAETLAGVAQKVQTANFLCFVSLFGQRNEEPSRLEREQSVQALAAIEQQRSVKAQRQLS